MHMFWAFLNISACTSLTCFPPQLAMHTLHGAPLLRPCRRGRGLGIDFFHCMTCNSCMSLSLFKTHKCRERAMEANCPVCNEYLFDSADPIKVSWAGPRLFCSLGEPMLFVHPPTLNGHLVVIHVQELPCAHFMHSRCFAEYTRYNYTCPLCSKWVFLLLPCLGVVYNPLSLWHPALQSCLSVHQPQLRSCDMCTACTACRSVGDMSVYFQMLDSLLASEQLPPEYAGRMQQVSHAAHSGPRVWAACCAGVHAFGS